MIHFDIIFVVLNFAVVNYLSLLLQNYSYL